MSYLDFGACCHFLGLTHEELHDAITRAQIKATRTPHGDYTIALDDAIGFLKIHPRHTRKDKE